MLTTMLAKYYSLNPIYGCLHARLIPIRNSPPPVSAKPTPATVSPSATSGSTGPISKPPAPQGQNRSSSTNPGISATPAFTPRPWTPPEWADYLPDTTGMTLLDALTHIDPTITEVVEYLKHDTEDESHMLVGDSTNLALEIDPSLDAKWHPYYCSTSTNKMYVRVSYITAAEIIFAYYLGDNNDSPVVVSGTEGTGKTMFANVFIWRLLSRALECNANTTITQAFENLSLSHNPGAPSASGTGNNRGFTQAQSKSLVAFTFLNMALVSAHPIVMYQNRTGQGYVYIAGQLYFCGRSLKELLSNSESNGFLDVIRASRQRAWLIGDTHPIHLVTLPMSVNQIYIATTEVATSAENNVVFRDAEVRLITPIWSYREIFELFDLCFPNEQLVCRRKVKALYAISGGIPRSIFNESWKFPYDESTGELVLSAPRKPRLGTASWERIVQMSDVGVMPDFEHDKISWMFHVVPRPIARELYGQPVSQWSIIRWASPWLANEAVKGLQAEGIKKSTYQGSGKVCL
jgi:hypothetical protein